MVFLNDGIKDSSKVLVGVPVTSIDTTVLVVKLHSTGNGLGQGESRSLGLDLAQFVPLVSGHMLGYQGVGGPISTIIRTFITTPFSTLISTYSSLYSKLSSFFSTFGTLFCTLIIVHFVILLVPFQYSFYTFKYT